MKRLSDEVRRLEDENEALKAEIKKMKIEAEGKPCPCCKEKMDDHHLNDDEYNEITWHCNHCNTTRTEKNGRILK